MFDDTKTYFKQQIEDCLTIEEKRARIQKVLDEQILAVDVLKEIQEELKNV
jgi:hypothetical protein